MRRDKISSGTVHRIPDDFRNVVLRNRTIHAIWEDITPLARNEWICWITSAKQAETRERRIRVAISKMSKGMRRPCCWAGCPHR
ncbi:MAG: YdeI/OmpD-associated family protein [Patescibacteria group bacterium]|nr:YdeI/OmpD-associated family protein [Patescibacteria group bacterium]